MMMPLKSVPFITIIILILSECGSFHALPRKKRSSSQLSFIIVPKISEVEKYYIRGLSCEAIHSHNPETPDDDSRKFVGDGVGVEAVQDIIRIREKAKRKKDFLLAEKLRDELIENYGVRMNGGDDIKYNCNDVEAVQDIIKICEKAWRKKDFLLADELRDELIENYGVDANNF